jgi:hypothetical protein
MKTVRLCFVALLGSYQGMKLRAAFMPVVLLVFPAAQHQTEAQTVTINAPHLDPLYAHGLYVDASYGPSTSAQPYHEIRAWPATYG